MKLSTTQAVEVFGVVMPDGSIVAAHICETAEHARNLRSALRKHNGGKGEAKRLRVTVEIIDEPRD